MTTATKRLVAHISSLAKIGVQTVYTVPIGHRTILKSLQISSGATAPSVVQVFCSLLPVGNTTVFSETVPAGELRYRESWLVLEPGDTINVNTQLAGVSYWMSGAELPISI